MSIETTSDEFDTVLPHIKEFLKSRVPQVECSVCGKKEFSVVGAYHRHEMQKSLNRVELPGVSIPAVTLVCNYCGNMYNFSLKVMGIDKAIIEHLEENENEKNTKESE